MSLFIINSINNLFSFKHLEMALTHIFVFNTGKTVFPTPQPTSNILVLADLPGKSLSDQSERNSAPTGFLSLLSTLLCSDKVRLPISGWPLDEQPLATVFASTDTDALQGEHSTGASSGNSVKSQCRSLKNLFWCCP